MNHEAASGRLLELAYGDLPPREAREVEAHAAECPACREELAGMRATRALMARLPAEAPPARGESIVMAAARQAAEARRPRPLLPRWIWAGSAGAVAAAAVAVVSWQLAKTPRLAPEPDAGMALLGGPPPAAAAPEPSPAVSAAEKAASGPALRGAETEGAPAKRVSRPEAPRSASPAGAVGLQREEVCERMTGSPSASGQGAGAGSPSVAMGEARAKRAESPPAAPPAARAPSQAWSAPAAEADRVADAYAPPAPAASMPSPAPAPAPAAAPGKAEVGEMAAAKARAAPGGGRSMAREERKAAAQLAIEAEAPAAARTGSAAGIVERRAATRSDARAFASGLDPGWMETRSFAGCPGELRRWVFTSADGRVVRYARFLAESRRVEHSYGPDGRLESAAMVEGKVASPLPLDTPWLVRSARDAGIDAPPRCSPP